VLAGLGGGTEAEMSNPEYAPGTPGVAGAIAAAGCAGDPAGQCQGLALPS
jgi:hypothetical protein